MRKTHIAYVELPTNNVAQSKEFYGSLFGWTFQDWGPDYSAFTDAGIEGGFNGGPGTAGDHRTKGPLLILETSDLEAMATRVVEAGGTITQAIFAFPGGRRFHFTDPAGQELGVMQCDA
jgi:predicted enzyme related to lactoylglutathione lyase